MSIQPKGEDLRKAVKWISEKRKHEHVKDLKQLVDDASLKFNLSPKDAEFLSRFVTEN
ncbi:MAG: hypothetical protein L6247_07640 [Desulfobacteraceae bacterium]|nr:hypothetical protein [Pseudomonadota bacterium]MBU4462679.1 hypothetical protein [Pseudomonadota bacterium]MCG2755420.1 hypothetical protein [Desulfobacteraceae bacterium]NQT11030.1 hypothetical protein [Desulfobacteraceae bacterium]